uniref:DEgenerin Like n=1 Tax=Caenorhabditis japonica TaxID=281687 RepID=A0A8R1E0B1_CAEJA
MDSDDASGIAFPNATIEAEIDDEEIDQLTIDEETYKYLSNHYFRAGHEGCDEYTTLTTFHGMKRVFNSQNCPSLIFWCLVVTTCLIFYMMLCGAIISTYSKQPSFMQFNETTNEEFENDIELCSEQEIFCIDIDSSSKITCKEHEAHCISIRFSTKVKIRLKKKIDVYFKHGSEKNVYFLQSKPHTHHYVRLKVFQIERLNLHRASCHESWKDVQWISEELVKITKFNFNTVYSLRKCTELRYNYTGKYEHQQKEFPCQPACFETKYEVKDSKTRHSSENIAITFIVLETITHVKETRKTTLIDILSYLGGASSLFMGCSCVTLMEMFVFLFKLVTKSIWSTDGPEPAENSLNEKYAFEFSDLRNKRRHAIFNKETMEKYLLDENSIDVRSINLDKRVSFCADSIRKTPKLESLRNNRNFENIDIYDTDVQSEHTRDNLSKFNSRDEYSSDYQDEKLDTLGATLIPAETRRSRPPLRRSSTATSYASHTSKGSSSHTTRSFAPIYNNRKNSRAFTRNMPMNDF